MIRVLKLLDMASLPLIASCAFFILNCFTQSFAETSEIFHDNPEWKLVLKKIEELQEIVKVQDDRISTLEMQSRESSNLALKDLQITIKQQSDRIANLEAWIQDFKTILTADENGSIKNIDPKPMRESNEKNVNAKQNLERKGIFYYFFFIFIFRHMDCFWLNIYLFIQ